MVNVVEVGDPTPIVGIVVPEAGGATGDGEESEQKQNPHFDTGRV